MIISSLLQHISCQKFFVIIKNYEEKVITCPVVFLFEEQCVGICNERRSITCDSKVQTIWRQQQDVTKGYTGIDHNPY